MNPNIASSSANTKPSVSQSNVVTEKKVEVAEVLSQPLSSRYTEYRAIFNKLNLILWDEHSRSHPEFTYKDILDRVLTTWFTVEKKADQVLPFTSSDDELKQKVVDNFMEILHCYKSDKDNFKAIRKKFPAFLVKGKKDLVVGFSSLLGKLCRHIEDIRDPDWTPYAPPMPPSVPAVKSFYEVDKD